MRVLDDERPLNIRQEGNINVLEIPGLTKTREIAKQFIHFYVVWRHVVFAGSYYALYYALDLYCALPFILFVNGRPGWKHWNITIVYYFK